MSHTPNLSKRPKPPTFVVPALLALAGFTVIGLVLVERGRGQVAARVEAAGPMESPAFLDAHPDPAPSPATGARSVKSAPVHRFTPPQALEEVAPAYPRIAKIVRVQGPVEVDLRVDAQGRPAKATVLSGNSLLRAEALKAVQGWKFAPARENGRAVPSDFRIRFEFKLA